MAGPKRPGSRHDLRSGALELIRGTLANKRSEEKKIRSSVLLGLGGRIPGWKSLLIFFPFDLLFSSRRRWQPQPSLKAAAGRAQAALQSGLLGLILKELDMERKKASDYPQELLDLFHEYQHGDIDRRTFLDRAGKFAVGGLTVAAIFESMKPNYAWAQQVPKDDKRLKTSYETVQSPQGNGSIKGYFARPASASGKLPAVLVIHENRGLNPYIEDVARRFAVANFIAFAPDGLTSVGGYPGDDEKGAVAFRSVNGPKMLEDFVASANWLRSHAESSGKLGAVGFCFGGGIVNQ